jgi:hypothetical protein
MNGDTTETRQNQRTSSQTTTRLRASGSGGMRLRQMRATLQRRNFDRKARKDLFTRRLLQALDDAITYRTGQASQTCPACAGLDGCAEHAENQALIWTYQQMHAATFERLHQAARPKPGNLR